MVDIRWCVITINQCQPIKVARNVMATTKAFYSNDSNAAPLATKCKLSSGSLTQQNRPTSTKLKCTMMTTINQFNQHISVSLRQTLHVNSKTMTKERATSPTYSVQPINEVCGGFRCINRPPSCLSRVSWTIELVEFTHKFFVTRDSRFKRFMCNWWLNPVQPTAHNTHQKIRIQNNYLFLQ